MKFLRPLRHGIGLGCVLAAVAAWAAEPRVIADLHLTLVPIPSGDFIMGSPATEVGRSADEGPQTHVTISRAFWLGQTEVTHAQWRALMGTDLLEQARRVLADDHLYAFGGKPQTLRDYFGAVSEGDPRDLVYNADDDAPMYWVSWHDAAAFCRRLTERERAAGRLPDGFEYRLPTEAEWEYACRAGTTEATYAGNLVIKGKANAPVLDSIAWYRGNSSEGYTGKGADTTYWQGKQYLGGIAAQRKVATKQPNSWGLYDMLGNVWEWCGDWYDGKLPGGSVLDPAGPALGTMRVGRGGCWHRTPAGCRAAFRAWIDPGARYNSVGFRLALAPIISR